ncbi:hypothetical protein CRYUN_Cryun02cG0184200 [Craigia yunnanensis]
MESKRQVGSSSSFTADLFGSKESSSSSKGIFSSIFQPPSSVGERNSSSSKVLESWPKQPLEGSAWRHGMQALRETNSKSTCLSTQIKKDVGEDDPNGNNSEDASRGNWWQCTDIPDEASSR